MANKIDFQVGYTVDKAGLNEIQNALKQVQLEANKASKSGTLTSDLKEASKAAQQLQTILNNSWNSKLNQLDLNKLNNSIKTTYGSVEQLRASFILAGNAGHKGASTAAIAYNKFASSVLNTNLQLKQSNRLLDSMAITMANTVRWGVTSSIFNTITTSIQKAYTYTKNLDSSLNDIRIVTDKSADSMESFAKQANAAAKSLGASTLDYTQASLIYYQQGLSDKEVQARAETTLKAANVTRQTGEEVSEQLTAVWNGYKVAAEETELYVDKLAAVAATTASDLEELSISMSKVASAAAAMGIDIDKLNGMLSTVISVTRQAPESAGTAFKTIFARMEDLELDGEDEFGVSLGEVSSSLESMGVHILDAKGSMRELGEVIEEVGNKWNSGAWSDAEKQALAIDLAGKRQYNNLLALFENWDMYNEAVETSVNSIGTLQEQQDIYMESTVAHLEQLRTEADKTYDILLDQDGINSFIDAATGALEIFNNYLTGLNGGLNSIVHMGSVIVNLFNNQIGKAINNSLNNIDAYRINLNNIELKQKIIDAHTIKGENITNSAAIDKEAEIAQELLNIRQALTSEQYNELTAEQQRIGILEQEIKDIESYETVAKEIFNDAKATNVQYELELRDRQSTLRELEEERDLLINLHDYYRDSLKITTNITELEDERLYVAQKLEGYAKRLPKELEAQREEVLAIVELFLEGEINSLKEIDELIEFQTSEVEEQKIGIEQVVQALEHKKQAENGYLNQLKQEQEVRQKIIDQEKQQAERQRLISQAISGLMTIVSISTTVLGIIQTINNEDLTFGQKLQAITTTLLMSLPMILMNFKDILKILPGLATGLYTVASGMGSVAASEAIAAGATTSLTGALSALWAVAWPFVAIAAEIAAVIATVIIVVKQQIDAYNADADAAERAAEKTKELRKVYEETKTAAEQLKQTINDYSDALIAINKLEKGTTEYKQAIIEANDKALKLLDTYKNLANFASRNKDGLIIISDEGLDSILEQQVKESELAQARYAKGQLNESVAQQRSDLTNFKRTYKVAVDGWNKLSEEILLDIADYMKNNQIIDLIPEDLMKIDSIANANEEVYKSILDNISAYSKMGSQLNDTREAQKLLADTCAEAIYKLNNPDYGIDSENAQLEAAELSLFTTYQNRYALSKEEQEAAAQAYIDKKWQEFVGDDGLNFSETFVLSPTVSPDGFYVPGYNPGQITAADAHKYAEMMGYDLQNSDEGTAPTRSFSGFLGSTQNWNFYKNGELVESLQNEELTQAIVDKTTELENLEKAKIEAPELLASIDDFINKLNFGDNKNVFDNLLLSGHSNTFNLEKAGMSQQQAKDILGNWDEVIAAFEGYDETTGFWQKQGFEDAQAYLDALKVWLEDRSNISDATAIGEKTIALMQSGTKNAINDVLSGELTSENAAQNESYVNLVRQLKQLSELFPELSEEAKIFSEEGLIGTETWSQAAFVLKEKLNNLKLQSLNDSIDQAFEDLKETKETFSEENGELDIEAWLQSDEFENALDELLDANYAIDVEIHTQAENAFKDFELASQNLAEQAKKIGDGYVVAASDIRELNNAFPGIIDNMELVGDGSVKLNEQIVKSAMNSANAEIVASAQSTLEQLQDQDTILRNKQKIYQAMYEAALVLAEGEGDTAENIAIIKEGFDKLEAENNKIASDTEMDNAALVASDSYTQAGIMAENWNSAYESSANSAIAFAKVAVDVAKAAQTGEMGNISTGDFGVTYQGRNAQSSEAAALANLKNISESASTKQDYLDLAESFKNAAEAIGKQANDIEGMIAQIGADTIDFSNQFSNISKGKTSSEKDPDYIDYLENEADRYHDINLELEALETNLDRLNKQQKKLYGKDLIKNLNEQLKILEKQKAAYEVKLQIAKAEARELRSMLTIQGVSFNSDGYITNYASVLQAKLNYVNSVIAQYNSMSAEEQKSFKDVVEAAKKDYQTFESQIKRYDELVSSFIPDIEDSIQDAVDKEIEINIQKFTMEIELRLDMAEAERDFNEFKRKVIDGIKDDDILGIAKSKLKDYTSYFNTEGIGIGPIQKLTDQINNTMTQIRQIDNRGWTSVYGDNKDQAIEDLQKYYKELMKQLEDVVDLVDEIKESYLDMIDEAVEAFDKQVDQYEYIKDLLDHDMNLVGLIYGDKAYAQMAQYYEKIEQNNNQELDFLKKRVVYAEEMMNKETDPKAKEKWEEEWMDALKKLNDKVEDSIQNIIDKYQNAINQVFDELNKKVTDGKGLDYVNDEWDLINKNADQYLDTINSLYAIQDLENKYLEALDQTDSLSAQQKLNDMMNEQLDMLKDKEKLTQYDVDRANMMYEITLKQIALEEAQQNKSKMRLRRDSQGNYSYQFVSDEDSIAQAQQDLLAAQNDLYNFDKEHYRDNLNEIYEIYSEFQEKLLQLYMDQTLTAEERAQKEAMYVEQYGQLINGLVEQNEDIKTNLHESAFNSLAGLYEIDVDNFNNMSEAEQDILMNSLVPQWDSSIQHMADVFAGEGGFISTCQDAFDDLKLKTEEYESSLDELEKSANVNFNSIAEGYDKNIELAQGLLDTNDELINKYMKEVDAILAVIAQLDQLITRYKTAQTAAEAATSAAYAFIQTQKANAAASASNDNKNSSSNSNSSSQGTVNNSNKSTGGSSSGDGIPRVGDIATYTGGLYYYDSYGTSPSGSRGPGRKVTITHINPNAPYPIHVESSDSAYGWLKKGQISGYDTGGYTGDWGNNNGKLAILHKKELVLKDTDTENVLMAVNIVRDMASMLNNINSNIMDRLLDLSTGFDIPINNISTSSDAIEQMVHIDASFPGVKSSNEIEQALNNLVNVASQYAYRNKR